VVEVVDSASDPRVADYRDVRDGDLMRERSLFMVEGRGNVRRLIEESPYRPRSLFLSKPACNAMTDLLEQLEAGTSVYVASREVLGEIAGFDVHRGCLAACDRPPVTSPAEILTSSGGPSTIVVLEGLTNPDNVGAVFRNAMAFGADAVLLCPRCCDPLYRKAIRVSMGAALCVPTARFASWPDGLEGLRATGYQILALDPASDSLELGPDRAETEIGPRVALVLGTEGKGLSNAVREAADLHLRIGMVEGFDSLNVATAAGVALHHLFLRRGRFTRRGDSSGRVGV
jgi:tRNA G18 (ribose-2'-O)-methylase SpoU